MSFETDLPTKLEDDAAVNSLVGSRIYWGFRPQDSALPAIVLHLIAGQRDQHLGGVISTQGNQVQFDCMAKTTEQSAALRNAVIVAIEAPAATGSTTFQGGNVDLYRGIVEDTAAGTVRTEQVRATIWFN